MIKYKTIMKAKQGNQDAINEILIYYIPKILSVIKYEVRYRIRTKSTFG